MRYYFFFLVLILNNDIITLLILLCINVLLNQNIMIYITHFLNRYYNIDLFNI